jgi:hypothetical protein
MGLAEVAVVDKILDYLRTHPGKADNLDLRGEFLLARRYLHADIEPVQLELDAISQAQKLEGWWEGPVDLSEKMREEGVPAKYWSFFLNYHTTLVCREAVSAWNAMVATYVAPAKLELKESLSEAQPGAIHDSSFVSARSCSHLQRCYHGMLRGDMAISPASCLLDPVTVTRAADWFLLRSVLVGRGVALDPTALDFIDVPVATLWSNLRLARIGLTLAVAAQGQDALHTHQQRFSTLLSSVYPRAMSALSLDEACLISLACMGDAVPPRDKRYMFQALELALYRWMGAHDIPAAVQVALFMSLAGVRVDSRGLSTFVSSYQAVSMPFGYLAPEDELSHLSSARLRIAFCQYLCFKRLRRLLPNQIRSRILT